MNPHATAGIVEPPVHGVATSAPVHGVATLLYRLDKDVGQNTPKMARGFCLLGCLTSPEHRPELAETDWRPLEDLGRHSFGLFTILVNIES